MGACYSLPRVKCGMGRRVSGPTASEKRPSSDSVGENIQAEAPPPPGSSASTTDFQVETPPLYSSARTASFKNNDRREMTTPPISCSFESHDCEDIYSSSEPPSSPAAATTACKGNYTDEASAGWNFCMDPTKPRINFFTEASEASKSCIYDAKTAMSILETACKEVDGSEGPMFECLDNLRTRAPVTNCHETASACRLEDIIRVAAHCWRTKIVFGQKIGYGGNGIVVECLYLSVGVGVAVKLAFGAVACHNLLCESEFNLGIQNEIGFFNEITVSMLRKFIMFDYHGCKVGAVMFELAKCDFAKQSSIWLRAFRNSKDPVYLRKWLRACSELATKVKKLAKLGILHGDFNFKNCLLIPSPSDDSRAVLRISDFGNAWPKSAAKRVAQGREDDAPTDAWDLDWLRWDAESVTRGTTPEFMQPQSARAHPYSVSSTYDMYGLLASMLEALEVLSASQFYAHGPECCRHNLACRCKASAHVHAGVASWRQDPEEYSQHTILPSLLRLGCDAETAYTCNQMLRTLLEDSWRLKKETTSRQIKFC